VLAWLEAVFSRVAREPEIKARMIAWGLSPAVASGTATRNRLARRVGATLD